MVNRTVIEKLRDLYSDESITPQLQAMSFEVAGLIRTTLLSLLNEAMSIDELSPELKESIDKMVVDSISSNLTSKLAEVLKPLADSLDQVNSAQDDRITGIEDSLVKLSETVVLLTEAYNLTIQEK